MLRKTRFNAPQSRQAHFQQTSLNVSPDVFCWLFKRRSAALDHPCQCYVVFHWHRFGPQLGVDACID